MDGGRVVYGVDFSPVMLRAIPWVRNVLAPNGQSVLVHAIERGPIPPSLRATVAAHPDNPHLRRLTAQRKLENLAATVGLTGEVIVREGRADDVLRQAAHDARANLIVMGAHGGRSRPWMRLGTTTERLLRSSPVSLLIARGPMAGPPKTIVVALDDVEITTRVLSVAGNLADAFDAELRAVHVLSNAAYSHLLSSEAAESATDDERVANIRADLADEALRWLRELWQHTRRRGRLHAEVPHGNPGEEILRLARERAADLVVIGRYGIGRALPAVLGSVVGSVVAGAECPVLVVTS